MQKKSLQLNHTGSDHKVFSKGKTPQTEYIPFESEVFTKIYSIPIFVLYDKSIVLLYLLNSILNLFLHEG